MSGSQIVNPDSFFFFEFLQRLHMASCQIHHMDVITHTGSIQSIIVIAEYADAFQLSNGHLCHIRQQIVGDSLGILSDPAGFMCTDGIKVTKQDHIPLRIGLLNIHQYLLQHGLGLSIRIGRRLLWTVLCDRNLQRISVYGRRRTEDDIFHAVLSHGITQKQCSRHIVVIVFNRLFHRLSHCFVACKMNHRIRLFRPEDLIDLRLVQKVCFVKFQSLSCDLLYPVQRFLACIVQIVYYYDFVAFIQKLHTGMTSDIAGTARNQDFHTPHSSQRFHIRSCPDRQPIQTARYVSV